MKTISQQDFYALDKSNAVIVDVREVNEEPIVDDYKRTLIPLGEIATRMNEIPHDGDVYVICRSGARSASAVNFLMGNGYNNLINVEGGTLGFIQEKDNA